MLTKERTSKSRKLKYVAIALALLSVLVFCFASCGEAVPVSVEYVTGTAQKVEYNEGDTFDCTGAKIKVTYDNGVTETKDVTEEMYGVASLTIGMTSVTVTYSENGKTVVGYIPVTVKDPYVAARAEALEAINTNATVKEYPTDQGFAALISEYVAKVNAAADDEAISTVVDNFNAAVTAYNKAKLDAIDALNRIDFSELHDQFRKDIESVKAQALQNIRVAGKIEEANEYVANFQTHVDNKILEQKFYEDLDGEEGKGQIYDKMDILRAIRAYQDRVDTLIEIIQKAQAADQITGAMYNEKMYGVDDEAIDGYEEVRLFLIERYNYITLAINLDGQMEMIDKVANAALTTPVDKLVDDLTSVKDGADVTVYPAEYALGENGYEDGKNVTKALLDKVYGFIAQAEAEFGADGLATLLKDYGVNSDTNRPIVVELIETIQAKYDYLMAVRADAVAQNVIDLINAAVEADLGDTKAAALDAAWAAYKAWGVANGVFAEGETVHNYNDNVAYDGKYAAVYTVTLVNDKWNSTSMGAWTEYDFTGKKFVEDGASYISTYFVPNLDKLITATQAQDAYEVAQIADLIKTVIFSGTTADDKVRIENARTELEEYRTFYIKDNAFAANGLTDVETLVKNAEDRYVALKDKAEAVNAAIDSYESYYSDVNHNVVKLEDYRGATGANDGALAKAYKAYCEFAAMNTDEDGTVYTDVITNKSGNEDNLLKFVHEYFVLEYEDQRHAVALLKITPVLLAKYEQIDSQDTKYREAVKKYFEDQLAYIGEDAGLDYKTEINGLVQDKFNRVAIYEANYAALQVAINATIAGIENATGADDAGLVY